MKKYIAPDFEIVELENEAVIATSSVSVSNESVDDTFNYSVGRKRGADWESYEQ